jgi:hypothetical protein
MKYLVGVTDLYYKKTKIETVEAGNRVLAMLEAAYTVNKGETLAGELTKIRLGKKGKMHTIETLKSFLIKYWDVAVSTPIKI